MSIDSIVTVMVVGFSPKQFSVFRKNLFKQLKNPSEIIDNHTDVLVIFVPSVRVHSLRGRISKTILIAGENHDDVANLSAHIELNMKIRHIITQHHHQPGLDTGSDAEIT